MGNIEVCEKSPLREHIFIIDIDDRRFKECRWCGKSVYRSDEEIIKDLGEIDKLDLEEE